MEIEGCFSLSTNKREKYLSFKPQLACLCSLKGVWVSWQRLQTSDELAVGTVGKECAGPQIQGNLARSDLNLAHATGERGGLIQLKQLQIAARGKLFADATESLDY